MQNYTEKFLDRLLETCLLLRSTDIIICLEEQEKLVIWDILNELLEEGYINGFCPQVDTYLRCDLTSKALDLCDFSD